MICLFFATTNGGKLSNKISAACSIVGYSVSVFMTFVLRKLLTSHGVSKSCSWIGIIILEYCTSSYCTVRTSNNYFYSSRTVQYVRVIIIFTPEYYNYSNKLTWSTMYDVRVLFSFLLDGIRGTHPSTLIPENQLTDDATGAKTTKAMAEETLNFGCHRILIQRGGG